ncbi:carbohydrate porin [Algicola sagamiensis]|uniref:carbohydrate porin n=1 Tax=Algicola sagamiensis TaxID=163869 RepID=UPI000381B63D|nr:carbohydrate porin [Algicola sagamiensis]
MQRRMLFIAISSLLSSHAIADVQTNTEFHGYLRTGLGASESGQTQANFQLPGARAKYRLGNESDSYIELAVEHQNQLNTASGNKNYRAVFMVNGHKPHGEGDLSIKDVTQAYVEMDDIIADGMHVWVGRRYYDRRDIHMNDYYWLSSGQGAKAGAGLGTDNWDLALFRFEDKLNIENGSSQSSEVLLNSSSLDFRYRQQLNQQHQLTYWLGYTKRHQTPDDQITTPINGSPVPVLIDGFSSEDGFALGTWLDSKVFGGNNTVAFLYRNGATVDQGNGKPVNEMQGYDLSEASMWEINNNFVYNDDRWSAQWALIARQDDKGKAGKAGSKISWYSTGIRPVYYFNEHVSFATELGYDHVKDEIEDRSGGLTKLTFAVQVAKGKGYYTRPVLRAFVTTASWSDEFKGMIGTNVDAPYGDDTSGTTLGIQVESWW